MTYHGALPPDQRSQLPPPTLPLPVEQPVGKEAYGLSRHAAKDPEVAYEYVERHTIASTILVAWPSKKRQLSCMRQVDAK